MRTHKNAKKKTLAAAGTHAEQPRRDRLLGTRKGRLLLCIPNESLATRSSISLRIWSSTYFPLSSSFSFLFAFFFLFFLLSSLPSISLYLFFLCSETIDESQSFFAQSRQLLASPMFRYKLHEEDTNWTMRSTEDEGRLGRPGRGSLTIHVRRAFSSSSPCLFFLWVHPVQTHWKLMLSLNWPNFLRPNTVIFILPALSFHGGIFLVKGPLILVLFLLYHMHWIKNHFSSKLVVTDSHAIRNNKSNNLCRLYREK